ncbi:hypothetical protein BDZ89DRAFT_1147905 [Hymenopellis radicata]|nr:hypothetical protein BDZ89DRAFT_1147905 [Hymenopellis radicata]
MPVNPLEHCILPPEILNPVLHQACEEDWDTAKNVSVICTVLQALGQGHLFKSVRICRLRELEAYVELFKEAPHLLMSIDGLLLHDLINIIQVAYAHKHGKPLTSLTFRSVDFTATDIAARAALFPAVQRTILYGCTAPHKHSFTMSNSTFFRDPGPEWSTTLDILEGDSSPENSNFHHLHLEAELDTADFFNDRVVKNFLVLALKGISCLALHVLTAMCPYSTYADHFGDGITVLCINVEDYINSFGDLNLSSFPLLQQLRIDASGEAFRVHLLDLLRCSSCRVLETLTIEHATSLGWRR